MRRWKRLLIAGAGSIAVFAFLGFVVADGKLFASWDRAELNYRFAPWPKTSIGEGTLAARVGLELK